MTSFTRVFATAALLLSALPMAQAQTLQAGKPIRLIVALSPGGGTDVTARLVAQKMSASMGMNVLVENKTGGNRTQAGREARAAPADDHTRCIISTCSLSTQAQRYDYRFDLAKFTGSTEVAAGPLMLVGRNDHGGKTLPQ